LESTIFEMDINIDMNIDMNIDVVTWR
jgi:hypothetical protein